MADVKITALPASAGLALTDIFPTVDDPGGAPVTEKATYNQLVTLLNTVYGTGPFLPLAGGTLTGLLTIAQATANTSALISTGYSLTGADATSMIDLAGTWNTAGTPTAFKLNITDTASAGVPLLMDLQRSGASRFKVSNSGDVTIAGTANANSIELTNAGGFISWTTRSVMYSKANGTILMQNAAETDFNRLQFGGTTSAFPSIKRSAATLQVRLADDSAFGDLSVLNVLANNAASLITSSVAMTSGPGVSLGTITDAPSAGNPDVWCPITLNGVVHWFPCWSL